METLTVLIRILLLLISFSVEKIPDVDFKTLDLPFKYQATYQSDLKMNGVRGEFDDVVVIESTNSTVSSIYEESYLVGYDLNKQEELWRCRTHLQNAYVIDNNFLYRSEQHLSNGELLNSKIICTNILSGEILWECELFSEDAVEPSPHSLNRIFAGERHIFVEIFTNGKTEVCLINKTSGEKEKSLLLEGITTNIFAAEQLIAEANNKVMLFDIGTFTICWESNNTQIIKRMDDIYPENEMWFLKDHKLTLINLEDGKTLQELEIPYIEGELKKTFSIKNDVLNIHQENGEVILYSLETGKVCYLDKPLLYSFNDDSYICFKDEFLECYSMADSKLLWEVKISEEPIDKNLLNDLLIAEDSIFLQTMTKTYVLSLSTGALLNIMDTGELADIYNPPISFAFIYIGDRYLAIPGENKIFFIEI